ncbi:MAG: twin-arginine translocase TatA/TatE family subunit [Flavobacteriales bacterium]
MNNQILLLFNIGGGELFFIVLIIIMFFGSKKIPELARGLGKGIKELKNATNDIQQEIKDNTKDITRIKDSVNVEKQVKDLILNSEQKHENFIEEPPQPSQPNTVSRSTPTTSVNTPNTETPS